MCSSSSEDGAKLTRFDNILNVSMTEMVNPSLTLMLLTTDVVMVFFFKLEKRSDSIRSSFFPLKQ